MVVSVEENAPEGDDVPPFPHSYSKSKASDGRELDRNEGERTGCGLEANSGAYCPSFRGRKRLRKGGDKESLTLAPPLQLTESFNIAIRPALAAAALFRGW